MNRRTLVIIGIVAALLLSRKPADKTCPDGKRPVPPVMPKEPDKPKPKPRPWGDDEEPVGSPVEGGKVSPDGKAELILDLPESEKKRNVGGRDGAGLCVFTSIEYLARYQNERRLVDFQAKMRQEPGGGWPEKVDKMIAKYGAGTRYIQSTAKDFELVKAAFRSGRGVGTTYNGHDPHYGGSIAHMVAMAYADDQWVAITDNNFPKDTQLVWMSPSDYKSRWDGWVVILLSPPPPPPPHN